MGGVTKQEGAARQFSEPDAPLSAASGFARPPKILCVDDEPAMLAILSRSLQTKFEIVTADDPVLALSLLERTSDFSVVISDMKMPQMDGADFLARVKKLSPSSTRLALTACLERQLAPEDVFGILTKPCPLNLLHESVIAAVQHHDLMATQLGSEMPASMAAACVGLGSGVRLRALAERASWASAGVDPHAPAVVPVDTRFCLRIFGKDAELRPGVTLLGRSKSCQIVVDDARISSRHARFVCSWRGVTLQDVSGTGGVRLNGERFAGARYIQLGDWVGVGPFDAEVRAIRRDVERENPEAPARVERQAEAEELDRAGDAGGAGALEVLSGVAEKFFRVGQAKDAERILEGPLQNFLRRCERGQRPAAIDIEMAVAMAVRLAEEVREPRWIEYTLRVFAAVGRTIPPSIVERLEPLTLAP